MPWLRVTLELLTPCFLSGSAGANSSADDLREEGVRAASLVGVWRFWLRALLGADGAGPGREAELFGSQQAGGRQGRIAVRSASADGAAVAERNTGLADLAGGTSYPQHEDRPAPTIDPLHYLLGMGLCSAQRRIQRPAFTAGQAFTVEVNVRRGPGAAEAWRDLRQALWLWQSLGGLGARSRRGWGAFEVVKVENQGAIEDPTERAAWGEWLARPSTEAALRQRLSSLCRTMDTEAPRLAFTAPGLDPRDPQAPSSAHQAPFSSLDACCLVTGSRTYPSWPEALAELGLTFLRGRSNANRGNRPRGEPRVQDHDAVHALLARHAAPAHAPFRSAFGLPHNYFFKDLRGSNKAFFEGNRTGEGRRASPLLVRVVRLAGAGRPAYLPVALWLKAPLTSDGRIRESTTRTANLPAPDWRAVVRFLQDFHAGSTAATSTGSGPGDAPPGGPAKVMTQMTSKPRPLTRGETRVGELRHNVFWVAVFPDANIQGRISNVADVPAGTASGTRAEFVIETVAPHGAFVRFVRVVTE